MLTYEDALFHKLLLEAGVTNEFAPLIDRMLAEEEPLSELALELAYSGADANKQLAALNAFLSRASELSVDMDEVYAKLIGYFRSRYELAPDDVDALVGAMYRVGMNPEYAYDNWPQLWTCSDYYILSLDGVIAPDKFKAYLLSILYGGECIDPWEPHRKPGLIERLKALMNGRQ